jgi:hypothetical protein
MMISFFSVNDSVKIPLYSAAYRMVHVQKSFALAPVRGNCQQKRQQSKHEKTLICKGEPLPKQADNERSI